MMSPVFSTITTNSNTFSPCCLPTPGLPTHNSTITRLRLFPCLVFEVNFMANWAFPLTEGHITQWHDSSSAGPIIYLGYPLFISSHQRDFFLSSLLEKISAACDIHKGRQLSVRGRVTVTNSLILSKLWHVLRVVSVPLSFFDNLRSIVSAFISYRIFPRLSYFTMCLPRSKGG